MMRHCWEKAPEDRPTFKELYMCLNKSIENVAGYLEMGFNPFSAAKGANSGLVEEGEKRNEGEEEKEGGVKSTLAAQ